MCRSGQTERIANPLAYAFVGSNPTAAFLVGAGTADRVRGGVCGTRWYALVMHQHTSLTRRLAWEFTFGVSALGLAGPVLAGGAVIDERFVEWSGADLVATDALGDAPLGVFDLGRVWAKGSGSELFVSFEMFGDEANLQAGPAQGGPQLWVGVPGGSDVNVFFRARTVSVGDLSSVADHFVNEVPWAAVDFALLPTVASTRYEMRVDLSAVGIGAGDEVLIDFAVPGVQGGAAPGSSLSEFVSPDALDAPVRVVMGPADAVGELPGRGVGRSAGTTLRVASLNTLASGLLDGDPVRSGRFDRLLRSAAADVYCFQEQAGSPQQIADRLAQIDPLGDGAAWNVHTDPEGGSFSSDYIASPLPLTPVEDPPLTDAYAAAVVGDDPSDAVLVLSVHPACCGFVGSSSDQGRIAEAEDTAAMLARFRAGQISAALAPFAGVPVVVIGDWNLVGSDTPREILTDPAGPGLSHDVLLNLDRRDAMSWRSSSGFGFAPGLLDLCASSRDGLDFIDGFVVDTADLSGGELAAAGLEAGDSLASDHLLLVADFRPAERRPDADGDGLVGLGDLLAVLGGFGETGVLLEGDVDDDLTVGLADLLAVLGAFGAAF